MGKRRGRPDTPTLFELEEPRPEGSDALDPAGYVRVALNRPVRREFTYAVGQEHRTLVQAGMRVAVPFSGRRRQIGVVVGVDAHSDVPRAKLRPILGVLDTEPVVDDELLGLTRWIAERYACSWGEALAAVLPAPLKRESRRRRVATIQAKSGIGQPELEELLERFPKQHRLLRTLIEMGDAVELRDILRQLNLSESPARSLERKGWVRIELVEQRSSPLRGSGKGRTRPARLSSDQTRALEAIGRRIDAHEPATFLLHGVTGSGKTEVYLQAIERALALGRSAIVLVPEIALTPQTVGWFQSRFGEVCVLHSRMTDAQRFDAWMQLKSGEVRVVVGARSALFAPVRDLGVIVLDEEHEPSFKQESVPRYHAREAARERARRAGAVCLLGSATPALETWDAARRGDIERLELPSRVGGGRMPTIHVVDMKTERPRRGQPPLFSRLLSQLLVETLEAREQVILFLNRRGFTPLFWCPGCKETLRCVQCSTALTYHRRIARLVCHSCCEEFPPPAACPSCSRPKLLPYGVGSERVEVAIKELFPSVRVQRMDSDTMRRREDYEGALSRFGQRELDVLVGTQMIAKGLDFPNVTLVGVINADHALHIGDFRGDERTFQLVAQVAGRAGRGELPGRIVVQTLSPDAAAIRLSARGDYEGFAAQECDNRQFLGYPPYGRLARALFESEDDDQAAQVSAACATDLLATFGAAFERGARLRGPVPAPFSQLRGRYRHHVIVAVPRGERVFEEIVDWLAERVRLAPTRAKLDVDPMAML